MDVSNLQIYSALPIEKKIIKTKVNRFIKRFFDVSFSLFVIVFIISWLFPILFILIKIDSRGSVFFVQERYGLNQNKFYCMKFRSMQINEFSNDKTTIRGDRRITKIGKFLRETSIDELPQFFNVLMGDMTIVGPRPHMIKQTEIFNQKIYNFNKRHNEKPGVTGLAQICGCRGEIKNDMDMVNRLRYDLFYIDRKSFFFDLKIIGKTIIQIIKGDENAI